MGHTPFILAAYNGHRGAAEWLLQQGAEPCATDQMGANAVMGVAFQGHEDVGLWLLNVTGCDVNHRNYAGQTLLMMSALFGRERMIEAALDAGADASVADNAGNTAASLARGQGLEDLADRLDAAS